MSVELIPVHVGVEIGEGDDVAAMVVAAAPPLQRGDVIVVTHKAVSKSEGRVVDLDAVQPRAEAIAIAADTSDARVIEVILRESRRIVRRRGSVLIVETHHGFVCANAGVDRSNAPRPDSVVLLPRDPDASARRIRAGIEHRTGVTVGVVVADTMGRAWREGIVGTAIGVSGLRPLHSLVGAVDPRGYTLEGTVIAVADEIAAAADLVIGKLDRVPFALVRGLEGGGDGAASELIRPASRDLFR